MYPRIVAITIAAMLIHAEFLADLVDSGFRLSIPDFTRTSGTMGVNFLAGVPAFCMVWLAEILAWRRGDNQWDWNRFRSGAFGALVFAAGSVFGLHLYHALAPHFGGLRSTAGLDFLFLPFATWKASALGFLLGVGLAMMVAGIREGERVEADDR